MLSVTGIPYDTLRGVIGMTGDANGSLKEFGIHYKEVQLKADGTPDYQAIEQAIEPNQKMVYIQRSRGYSLRPSLLIEDIEKIAAIAKKKAPNCIVMVDNCYGEFVQTEEPTSRGADSVSYTHLIQLSADFYAPQSKGCSGDQSFSQSFGYA